MAAPALKPCPVCRGTGRFLGRGFAACVCGMLVERTSRTKAAADWNRLSDIAEARTRAAVREALEEAIGAAEGTVDSYAAACAVFNRVHAMRAPFLDAASSAQPEGDADAD